MASKKKNGAVRAWIADPQPNRPLLEPVYSTKLGAVYFGDSAAVLQQKAMAKYHGKAQLVLTSPPFPLNEKKRYGNLTGQRYLDWFAEFAPLLTKFLTADGSIVVEIGNAWEPKHPVMSTIVLKALLGFLEKGGLKLCQEFVWYNPARLPSPVQWVNVERIRVKDAFTRIWWMSTTERPKADNRKVLRSYSKSMEKLLKRQTYNAGHRPSQHKIGTKSFLKNNAGAIPPNVLNADDAPSISSLLKGTNTRSVEPYQVFCRDNEIQLHPARMPADVAEFFVRFLTDEGNLVLDPFSGSNTTGATAEQLGRKWLSIDADWNYATSSVSRFMPQKLTKRCAELAVANLSQAAASPSPKLAATPAFTS